MIRLGRLTDYALVLMTHMARMPVQQLHTSAALAQGSRLPLPTVTKVLKALQQGELLISHRGVKGGYTLGRAAAEISVADVIAALEGPLALTACSTPVPGACDLESYCPIKDNQRIVNRVVRNALERVALSDLAHPLQVVTIQPKQDDNKRSGRTPVLSFVTGRIQ